MKRRSIAIIVILLSVLSAFAQSKQIGFVKQYNEKLAKTPLGGVTLNMCGASSTVSDGQGAFTLSFNTLKPGDKINYNKIAKSGYVLFNKDKVDQWNISNDNKPFTIIMCKEAKFKEIKDKYMKVSSASYARQQKKEEAALEAAYKAGKKKEAEYKRELNELRQYYAEQLKNIDTYVDQFSRIDLSELDAQEQAIIDMIQNGDIDGAINKYEKLNYLEKYEKEVQEVKELESIKSTLEETKAHKLVERDSIFAIVERQIDAYTLAGGKENFDKAGKLYKMCADADTTNCKVVWECADFYNLQRDYQKALKYYKICVNICHDNIYMKSAVQNNIACLYYDIHDYKNSEKYHLQNLEVRQALFERSPEAYRENLSETQNNLGNLYMDLKDYQKSATYYQQSLENKKILFKSDPDKYRASLASTQNNVGSMLRRVKNYFASKDYYLESLANKEILFKNNPDKYRADLAMIQMNLGILYSDIREYKKSEEYYLLSLENRNILFQTNPDAYRADVALIQSNLGAFYKRQKDYAKSEEYYMQSLENYKILFETDPNAYRQDLAENLKAIGLMYSIQGVYDKSAVYYEQSLEKYNQLFASEPDIYRSDLAMIQYLLGNLYFKSRNNPKSIEYYVQCLETYDVLFQNNPDTLRQTIYDIQCRLAIMYYKEKDYSSCEKYHLQSLENLKILYAKNPDKKKELASLYYTIGLTYFMWDRNEESLKYVDNAIALMPDEIKYYDTRGVTCFRLGKDQEAMDTYKKMLQLNPHYFEENPNSILYKLVKLKENGQ